MRNRRASPWRGPTICTPIGSPFSPLNARELQVELIKAWGRPVILVSSTTVGAIGRTLQTARALSTEGIAPAAVVLVGQPDAFAQVQLAEHFSKRRVFALTPPSHWQVECVRQPLRPGMNEDDAIFRMPLIDLPTGLERGAADRRFGQPSIGIDAVRDDLYRQLGPHLVDQRPEVLARRNHDVRLARDIAPEIDEPRGDVGVGACLAGRYLAQQRPHAALEVAAVQVQWPLERTRRLLDDLGHVAVKKGPKENRFRPSIDALFRSAARWAGPRVIGVVLTGARDDGKVGMSAIKQRGGIAIVQEPSEAAFPSMPMSVMQEIKVDYSVPLREIAPLLNELSRQQSDDEGRYPVSNQIEIEAKIAEQEMEGDEFIASVERIGKISKLTCPDCHGALWEIDDEDMLRKVMKDLQASGYIEVQGSTIVLRDQQPGYPGMQKKFIGDQQGKDENNGSRQTDNDQEG